MRTSSLSILKNYRLHPVLLSLSCTCSLVPALRSVELIADSERNLACRPISFILPKGTVKPKMESGRPNGVTSYILRCCHSEFDFCWSYFL